MRIQLEHQMSDDEGSEYGDDCGDQFREINESEEHDWSKSWNDLGWNDETLLVSQSNITKSG